MLIVMNRNSSLLGADIDTQDYSGPWTGPSSKGKLVDFRSSAVSQNRLTAKMLM